MKSLGSSIRRNIRVLAAPDHELAMSRTLWAALVLQLGKRGSGERESGAFLLGAADGVRGHVTAVVYYDDLEPGCLDSGIVNFTAVGYRKLWKVLKERGCEVIADVHTHPREAFFSGTDRRHPMMPTLGHRALVIPNYAQGVISLKEVGFYRYLGSYEWEAFEPGNAVSKVYVGWFA